MTGRLGPGFAALLAMAWFTAARAQNTGPDTYDTVCAACHQPTGLGVPGAFPPLAGHAPEILSRPNGRAYLARLVLYGLAGEITVDGKLYNAAMPAWGDALNDDQLAGALNHVLTSWGNDARLPPGFQPIQPNEIAAARAAKLTPDQVYAIRGQMNPAAPAEATTPVTFTEEQAGRGQSAYRRGCQDCHGFNLNDGEFGGAPLTGQYFSRHWGNGSVAALYGFLHTKMPPDRPGKLNPQTYADLTAFLLSKNGYQPGDTELPPDPDEHLSLKR